MLQCYILQKKPLGAYNTNQARLNRLMLCPFPKSTLNVHQMRTPRLTWTALTLV